MGPCCTSEREDISVCFKVDALPLDKIDGNMFKISLSKYFLGELKRLFSG